MERTSGAVWPVADSLQPLSEMAGHGCIQAIFQALSIDADFENISIDSTSCKVHQSVNGGEKLRIRWLAFLEAAEIRKFIVE